MITVTIKTEKVIMQSESGEIIKELYFLKIGDEIRMNVGRKTYEGVLKLQEKEEKPGK